MREAIRRFLGTLLATEPRRTWYLLGLMLLSTLTEGVGILLLVPLLGLVGLDVGAGSLGQIGEIVAGTLQSLGIQPTLAGVLVVFVLVFIARAVLEFQTSMLGARANQSLVLRLRKRLYRAISRMDWRFYSRYRASDFIHALTDDLARVSGMTTQALRLSTQVFAASVYLVLALVISPVVTGITAVAGVGLLVTLRRWNERARSSGAAISEASNALYSGIHEHLAAMKTAKSYGAEGRSIALFSDAAENVSRSYITVVRHHATFSALVGVGSVLLLTLVVYLWVSVMAVPVAALLLLLYLFARLVPRFSGVQKSYHQFLNVLPAFSRVMELIRRCEDAAEVPATTEKSVSLDRGIQLQGVRFGYSGKDDGIVLRDLDLWIGARETTALVGPSGAGKSTVADLIMGLLIPDQGSVLVDGVPLTPDRLRAWRRQIGYVPQEPFLFHETVRENLLWARPDATEDDLWTALRLASAETFVSRLPHGLETVVGDRGVLVSGGERQRLVLARALLRNPALLVMDEATSALDGHHESEIMEAIAGLRGRMTILIITHRIATVRQADCVHLLQDGKVLESGTWDDLLESEGGRFRELCRIQGIHPVSAVPSAESRL